MAEVEIQNSVRELMEKEIPELEEELKKLVLEILKDDCKYFKKMAKDFYKDMGTNKETIDNWIEIEKQKDAVYRNWLKIASEHNLQGGHLEQAKQAARIAGELKQYEEFENYMKERNNRMKEEKTSEIFKKYYSIILKYQNELNIAITGQSIKVIGVYRSSTGKNIELYEMTAKDIVNHMIPKLERGKLSIKSGLEGKKDFQGLKVLSKDKSFNFSIEGLDKTAEEIYQRYNYSKSRLVKSSIGYVLWKPNGRWLGIKIATLGDVDEAYSLFFLKDKKNPSFTKKMEINIDDFIRFGIQTVDNAPGILQGDVTGKDEQFYQIKGIGSSLGSVTKLFDVFDSLKNINENNLEESASKIVKLLLPGNKRNQVIDQVSKEANVDFKNSSGLNELLKNARARVELYG
jgi:hypothetical protein